jgi:glycosyltransferase involved in cell wall biosynthesis
MRILFCNYEYPPLGGGGGVINADLAEALADRHDVTVLTSRAMGLPEAEEVNGVEVVRVPVLGRKHTAAANMVSMATYLPRGASKGRKLLKDRPFDVINSHFVVPTGPVGAHLARKSGLPHVISVHGGDLYDPSKASSPHRHWFLRVAIRKLLRGADAVVGNSKNTLANVHDYYDADLPCQLISLGIPRPPASTKNRAALGFSDDELLMVTVGRLVSRKGLDQLVRMMGGLRERNVRLVIIGDGPLKPELEKQAADLGVADSVTFAGFVSAEDKVAILSASDLYVSTSQHEGFGLVYLEGMAAGLPVICYDFGGQTDFLEHDVTGGLISLNDEAAFAECVHRYLDSESLRQQARDACLSRVEAYFIDNCARQYESLFEEIIEQRRGIS